MNRQTNIEEDDIKQESNVLPFVKPAPKPPGEYPDWLSRLPKDTRFLARRKLNQGPLLDSYGIATKLDRATLLATESPTGPGYVFIWVDSKLFSQQNELYLVLPEPDANDPDKEAGQPQETEDG